MRRFSLLTLALCASFVGCKPATETVPKVTNPAPTTSATTDDAAPAEGSGGAAAEAKPAEGTVPEGAAVEVKPAEGAPADPAPATPPAETPTAPSDPSAGTSPTSSGGAVRFVADKKLQVPGMMCPHGCYPSVEKALASVPGVNGVQLAEQPAGTKDGEIALKVVELKLGEGFDLAAAIAALKKAEFDASEMN